MREVELPQWLGRLIRRRRSSAVPALALAPASVTIGAPAPVSAPVVQLPVTPLAPAPGVPTGAAPGLQAPQTPPLTCARPARHARVLLVASDRRFRAVASTLLSRRGYTVLVGCRGEDVAELAAREGADVVVLDASASLTAAARQAARLGSLLPPVGIVAVSAETQSGLAALPVLPKWTSFDELFGAIDRAHAAVTGNRAAHAVR